MQIKSKGYSGGKTISSSRLYVEVAMPFHVNKEPVSVANIQKSLADKKLPTDKAVLISFYIEVYSETLSKELAIDLSSEGFETDVDAFQQLQHKWRCWASVKIFPSILNLDWIVTLLTDKCERFGSTLEGWEVNPVDTGAELGQLMAQLEQQYEDGH